MTGAESANAFRRYYGTAKDDRRLIMNIVSRAVDEMVTIFLRGDLVDLLSDLALCHRRYRLDLEKLSALGKEEFLREIVNINRHVRRKTGEMPKGFMPRHLLKTAAPERHNRPAARGAR